jgi:NADPH:quinone reductase
MRAIIIKQFGGLDGLVIEKLPDPVPEPSSVLIQVKAFGTNHAETHMRKGEWAEAATVSGIECVGLVKSCPGGEFAAGTKVAAFMGGLGRTINGSYFSGPMLANDGEQIDRVARTAADLPVTSDSGPRSGW